MTNTSPSQAEGRGGETNLTNFPERKTRTSRDDLRKAAALRKVLINVRCSKDAFSAISRVLREPDANQTRVK